MARGGEEMSLGLDEVNGSMPEVEVGVSAFVSAGSAVCVGLKLSEDGKAVGVPVGEPMGPLVSEAVWVSVPVVAVFVDVAVSVSVSVSGAADKDGIQGATKTDDPSA